MRAGPSCARPLRVGLLASPAVPVPPIGYGGTEAVVAALAQELPKLGVEVKLAAAATIPGAFGYPVGLDLPLPEAAGAEMAHAAWAWRYLAGVDVIADHSKAAGVALAPWAPAPVVTTIHNDATAARTRLYEWRRDHPFVFLSQAHAGRYPGITPADIIYNGIEVAIAPFGLRRQDYLLFLGRFSPQKGAHDAIAVALAAGLPLILAGRIDPKYEDYFTERIAPFLDGERVRFVGEVRGASKWDLLARARCLLVPILWAEPFGLVMLEAMACGTPVIAYDRGAAAELVTHGRQGFLVRDCAQMGRAIAGIDRIDPKACRARVVDCFSATAMARNYQRLYARVLEQSKRGPDWQKPVDWHCFGSKGVLR